MCKERDDGLYITIAQGLGTDEYCFSLLSLCLLCIIPQSLLCTCTNVFFAHRLIRDSAPHINTVVIIGCIVMLVGCYLLGVDSNNPPVPGSEGYVDNVDNVPASVVDAQDYRYKVICNVSWISVSVCILNNGGYGITCKETDITNLYHENMTLTTYIVMYLQQINYNFNEAL